MIQTRKHLVLGMAALALTLGASALTQADTIVLGPQFNNGGVPQSNDFSGTFSFAQFNPTLGTLQSVKIDLGSNFSTTIHVHNNSTTTDSTGNVRTEVQDGLTDGSFTSVSNILGVTGPGLNFSVLSDMVTPPQGFNNLAPGGDANFGPLTLTGFSTGTFTSGAVLSEFTGFGTTGINYTTLTTTILTFDNGNTTATQSTNGNLSATVTYTYTTELAPTPEPGSVAMLFGMGVTGVAFVYRRRVKK